MRNSKGQFIKGSSIRLTHGMRRSSEYNSWSQMKKRCINLNAKAYPRYGGRGIKVCDRWLSSFENFYSDMGPKPTPQHSLDRIDNNGNYEPSNCRWATMKEQNSNRRSNIMITYNKKTLNLTEWGNLVGIKGSVIRKRLKRGWSIEKALTTRTLLGGL